MKRVTTETTIDSNGEYTVTRIPLDDSHTYVLLLDNRGAVIIDRKGQPWIDTRTDHNLQAAKAWIAAGCLIEEQQTLIEEQQEQIAYLKKKLAS